MKKFSITKILLIFIINLSSCCLQNNTYIIQSDPPISQVNFKEKTLETPAIISFKGTKPIEIELTQEGFVSQKVLLKPQEAERELTIKLEGEIKEIIIVATPSNATIHYGAVHGGRGCRTLI